jgi:tetratricopeptide (TPR) repeat protein
MIASPHLFELIRSLSPSEKRYFRLFSAKHVINGKNNYMKLFDVIEGMEEYDENRVKEKLKDQALVRNLAYEKNYLYDMLSDSLHVYHLNLSRESELRKQLHLVSIYFDKSLYPHCRKLLRQIRATAEELDKHNYMYEALMWEKKLLMQISYSGITEVHLQKLFEETTAVAEKMKNQVAYSNLSEMLRFLIDTSGQVRSSAQKKKFDKVIRNPLLKSETRALSNAGKRMYNSIWMNYHFYTNGPVLKITRHTSRELQLLEAKPGLIEENPNLYIGVLGNTIVTFLEQKNYPEATRYIDRLRSLPQTLKVKLPTHLRLKLFVLLYSQELTLYIESGEFGKVHEVIEEVENGLDFFDGKIGKTHAITIYYNLMYLYLGTGEFRKALKWLNKILQFKGVDAREDIICFSKILQLIIYFELNDSEALPHVFKSTYRYLAKRKRVYKGETMILNFIRRSTQMKTKKEVIGAYTELRTNFLKLSKHPFEKNLFVYFDFVSWLESKMENRDFASIIREKGLRHRSS